ncbi:tRNA (adenine(58)-N(1))-methyltransferase catalytic subunit TRM61 [Diplonema papillatum]|nr:tRNA (adenine(58)-N(1))-methyltransferase catalytic subunit TRM61 [Diplonema papillatum]
MLQTRPADNVTREGSLVMIYEGFTLKKIVTLKKGEISNTKGGTWKHESLMGRRYGDRVHEKVVAKSGSKWEQTCYLLRPNMELWTDCLMHRTQILYSCDIALVCLRLNLVPGKVVVEAGTGSGSLTHSLARAVAPAGRVHTFDFHEERSKVAAEEFASHGLGDIVKAAHRDVCIERKEGMAETEWGFGLPPGTADAVFLDVPSPWLAVPAVHATLRHDGVFCNFSPCIEQVQRTCLVLAECGFTSIRTHEVLRREFMEHSMQYRAMYDFVAPPGREEPAKDSEPAAALVAQDEDGASKKEPAAKRRRTGDGGDDEEAPAAVTRPVLHVIPISVSRGHTGYLTFAHKVPPRD